MVKIEIVKGPIDFFSFDNDRQENGAELIFNGHVRDTDCLLYTSDAADE